MCVAAFLDISIHNAIGDGSSIGAANPQCTGVVGLMMATHKVCGESFVWDDMNPQRVYR